MTIDVISPVIEKLTDSCPGLVPNNTHTILIYTPLQYEKQVKLMSGKCSYVLATLSC